MLGLFGKKFQKLSQQGDEALANGELARARQSYAGALEAFKPGKNEAAERSRIEAAIEDIDARLAEAEVEAARQARAAEFEGVVAALPEYQREAYRAADPAFRDAVVRLHQEEIDDALAALAESAPSPWVDYERGRCERALGRRTRAVESLQRAAEGLGEHAGPALRALIGAAAEAHRYPEGAAALERLEAIADAPIEAATLRVELLAAEGRFEEAIAAATEFLTETPEAASVWRAKGQALQAAGARTEAAEAYRAALALGPDPVSQSSLAAILEEGDAPQAARSSLDQRTNFHGEGIIEYPGIIPLELCQRAIQLFDIESAVAPGDVMGYGDLQSMDTTGMKTCWDYQIKPESSAAWLALDEALIPILMRAAHLYFEEYPWSEKSISTFSGLQMQRYLPGQHFDWHADSDSGERRLAAILYLNEDFEGGETEFRHQEVVYQPRAGSLLLFPPYWTHVHRGAPIRSGAKYIMTSFFLR